jgi:hypothetical protein
MTENENQTRCAERDESYFTWWSCRTFLSATLRAKGPCVGQVTNPPPAVAEKQTVALQVVDAQQKIKIDGFLCWLVPHSGHSHPRGGHQLGPAKNRSMSFWFPAR